MRFRVIGLRLAAHSFQVNNLDDIPTLGFSVMTGSLLVKFRLIFPLCQ